MAAKREVPTLPTAPINKVLIANRGEIACRIIRTLRAMGIKSVAVFSAADREALHVRQADEACFIGPAPAQESYLKIDSVLEAARVSGADAVHPGYGFLSENADFARACEEAGLKFIGPRSQSIAAMGSKSAAKLIMEKASVPLIPGYHGDDQRDDFLQEQADRIGYPLLIKAAFGGGGKGMRIVRVSTDFPEALQSCRREAQAFFGNDTVLLEKYLGQPRHIEIQIFCDQHGNAVYLYERDCSLQRRHQKIIEEAPAPGLSSTTRQAMGETALAVARAINYEGAGTVEFLYEDDECFYFMEMNTRLQVEHPVTEFITGLDLVEWQIRVARGEPLPLGQDAIPLQGHAIEARICAEAPDRDFLPSSGHLQRFAPPASAYPEGARSFIRTDTGVAQGDEVTIHYDSMVAKLIAWGEDRNTAIDRLKQALEDFQVLGVASNIHYLHRILSLASFRAAQLSTRFLERESRAISDAQVQTGPQYYAWAAAAGLLAQSAAAGESPWDDVTGWQLNGPPQRRFALQHEGRVETFILESQDGRFSVFGELATQSFEASFDGDLLRVQGKQTIFLPCLVDASGISFFVAGKPLVFTPYQADYAGMEQTGAGHLRAVIPGRVVALLVSPGTQVEAGQALMVVEAMKMEHTLRAPFKGRVDAVHFNVGDAVAEGAELVSLAKDQEDNPA